jgi:hypothetical protein
MRRSLSVLLFVAAFAGLLVTSGCNMFEQPNLLRVVKINSGKALDVDVADWWIYKDPTDPEAEPELVFTMRGESTKVELQYVEAGPGLPTWRPYEAVLTKATISYTRTQPDAEPFEPPSITYPMNFNIQADYTEKKTAIMSFEVAPAWWVEQNFSESGPTEVGEIVAAEATIRFSGYDSVAGKELLAVGKLALQFADFYDNPATAGR